MNTSSKSVLIRQLKTTADSVLEKECVQFPLSQSLEVNHVRRKDKPVVNTFGEGFFWTEIIDAAADIYNGVITTHLIIENLRY